MASGDNEKTLPERRVSRNSVRMSVRGGEEEDYDLVAGAISDGFRPMQPVVSESTTPTTSTTSVPMPYVSSGESDATSQAAANVRPSSIAKPPRPQHDSFSLRHDGGMGQIQEAGVTRTVSMSTDSTAPYIRTEEPYQGPSGPSHPYQMYAQNVRTRTLSVTTSSTVPMSDSAYNGPRGPTHPYGMYTQGIVPEANTDIAVAASIPVGFNGVGTQYQRRIGPEGEELADMIGPDGHTEQLPPYTRYPEEAYARKARDVEQEGGAATTGAAIVSITTAAAVGAASTQQGIPGAGGLGLATRNPEFESTDDLGSPQSRHSTRSFPTSSGSSNHEMQAVGAMSEKGKPLKPWQVWMKKRLWGIVPYWAICLTLAVMAMMAIILGSVVATLLKHKKPPSPKPESDTTLTTTVTYDATPIATPTDLPPLATGTWSFPLMSNRVSSTCFNDTQQSQAWNCNLIMSGLYLTVSKNNDFSTPGDYAVAVKCNESLTIANNVYSYGEQPPTIPNPLSLELVNDTLEPSRGPAWFRMMPYNKTVILPENTLTYTASDSSQKREFSPSPFDMGPGDFKRKNVAQVGDRPWICTWPGTFLELFIYPNQNSSWNRNPVTLSSGSATSTSTAGLSSPTNPTAATTNSYGKNGVVEVTSSTSLPSATPISGGDQWASGGPPPPPPYPRVIKLEERRVDGSPEATCVQVELTDANRPPVPVKDSNGNPISITISESEPPPPGTVITANMVSTGDERRELNDRDTGADISQCGCMWFLT